MSKRLNLIGTRFNHLYVQRFAYVKNERTCWYCICDCGKTLVVSGNSLNRRNTMSCGCLKQQRLRENGLSTHGRKGTVAESIKKSLAHTNILFSDSHKKAISDGLIGKKKSEAHKQNLCGLRPCMVGKNNSNYIDGRSFDPAYSLIVSARRRALKLDQTPINANDDKIKEIYRICHNRNKQAGKIVFHVDHIIPLSKGGLHHEDNLQILTAVDNMIKHNKMPIEVRV